MATYWIKNAPVLLWITHPCKNPLLFSYSCILRYLGPCKCLCCGSPSYLYKVFLGFCKVSSRVTSEWKNCRKSWEKHDSSRQLKVNILIGDYCSDFSKVFLFVALWWMTWQRRELEYLSHTLVNELSVGGNYHQVCHIDRGQPQEEQRALMKA